MDFDNGNAAQRDAAALPLSRQGASALNERDLIHAMRGRDRMAWAEWDVRFRSALERFARRSGVPRWDAVVCVAEVLEKEGMRFAFSGAALPDSMLNYLRMAVRNRYLTDRRVTERRERKHAEAALGGHFVSSVASQNSVRSSTGVYGEDRRPIALVRFTDWLEAQVPDDDRQVLAWISEQVPRRLIAEWLGISYEAAKKRCARLCKHARALATEYREHAPSEDRAALSAFFARLNAPSPAGDRGQ